MLALSRIFKQGPLLLLQHMTSVLSLDTWTGVVPVLLPLGQPTISSIGVASAGIAVPFFFYILAMFVMIIPIWMKNHEEDKGILSANTLAEEGSMLVSSLNFLSSAAAEDGDAFVVERPGITYGARYSAQIY